MNNSVSLYTQEDQLGVVVPEMDNSKHGTSVNALEFSFQALNVPVMQKKTVGRKISQQEAFALTRRILQKAEQARIKAAEIEAQYAISWEQA